MPDRQQFQSSITVSDELRQLLEQHRGRNASEEELRAQRVSFAYGNAPNSDLITKESVQRASMRIRLTDTAD